MRTNIGTLWLVGLIVALAACSSKKSDDKNNKEPPKPVEPKPDPKPEAPAPEDSLAPDLKLLADGIPHDIQVKNTPGWQPKQTDYDKFSWQSFAALTGAQRDNSTNKPLWVGWSATADYLNLVSEWSRSGSKPEDFPKFGQRYYPQACTDYCTKNKINCNDYGTLEQVGKINDAIFEADSQGLSADPVIAANGTFLRYEILMNQDLYNFVTTNQLYNVNKVVAGNVNATCGQNGGPEGVMTVKLAWMDVTDTAAMQAQGLNAANYHTEQRLVFTSGGQLSTGKDMCDLRTMALVGTHIGHKTESQPNFVWSTFEHNNNAPDCGAWKNVAGSQLQTKNINCPSTVSSSYSLYPKTCQADGSAGACQSCNTQPAANAPNSKCAQKFCVDQPPAAASGYSRICRQTPVTANGPYKDAYFVNQAWQTWLGTSVWSKYMLISTQWFDWWAPPPAPVTLPPHTCNNVTGMLYSVAQKNPAQSPVPPDNSAHMIRSMFRPLVNDDGRDHPAIPVPLLANTSMESYERSNCMGCHSKGALTNATSGSAGKLPKQGPPTNKPPFSDKVNTPLDQYYSTDFLWWLALEVPADGVTK